MGGAPVDGRGLVGEGLSGWEEPQWVGGAPVDGRGLAREGLSGWEGPGKGGAWQGRGLVDGRSPSGWEGPGRGGA